MAMLQFMLTAGIKWSYISIWSGDSSKYFFRVRLLDSEVREIIAVSSGLLNTGALRL